MEPTKAKKLEVIPVASLTSRRSELLNKAVSKTASTFDPRQPDDRELGSGALEKLRCDLSLNQPCAFLHILVPSVEKVRHDHTYCKSPDEEVVSVCARRDELVSLPLSQDLSDSDLKSSLNVSGGAHKNRMGDKESVLSERMVCCVIKAYHRLQVRKDPESTEEVCFPS